MNRWRTVLLVGTALALLPGASLAQSFDDGLLDRVRGAASMIPGNLPLAVHFQGFVDFEGPLSGWVQTESTLTVPAVVGVFQLRFPEGSIVVDAGPTGEVLGFGAFSNDAYSEVLEALQAANLIVITHEHHDHIAGLIAEQWLDVLAPKSLLTTEQLNTMVSGRVNDPSIRIPEEVAQRFPSVSYKELLPIAPGVVLIKSPGHTPGSQMVYVETEAGQELLLVGDVVWMQEAVSLGAQKPLAQSRRLYEDRDALADQLAWLQQLRGEVELVIAHDARAFEELFAAGTVVEGLYLTAGTD